jgi:thiamine biosynthesis lipoprotein
VSAPTIVLRLPEARVDERFRALGSDFRLIVSAPGARDVVARARAEIDAFERCASRFLRGSELCALNADPRRVVPASARLRRAVAAALWAARRSGGICDPTLLGALEAAGYRDSLAGARHSVAVAASPPAAPARPDPASRWRRVIVDDERGTIARPPGLRLDLGGSGKGHIADVVAELLGRARSFVVDAGGDIRVRGAQDVVVAHPLRAAPAAHLSLADGAVATSGVARRAWRDADGGTAHHLLDPATGKPARSGLVAVTALAPTALEAETLAKTALLGGAGRARRELAARGGVLVHAGGRVELVGAFPGRLA